MSLAAFSAALDTIVADQTTGHANFGELQKEKMLAYCPAACAFMGDLRKLALQAQTLKAMWEGGVSQAVGFLNNNTTLPNPTDLAGGVSLLHPTDPTSDWQIMENCIEQLLSDKAVDLSGSGPLATMVRAAGVNIQS